MELEGGAVATQQHVHRLPRPGAVLLRRDVAHCHLPALQRHQLLCLHQDLRLHQPLRREEHRRGEESARQQTPLPEQLLPQRQQRHADDQCHGDGGIGDHVLGIVFQRHGAAAGHLRGHADAHIDGIGADQQHQRQHQKPKGTVFSGVHGISSSVCKFQKDDSSRVGQQ